MFLQADTFFANILRDRCRLWLDTKRAHYYNVYSIRIRIIYVCKRIRYLLFADVILQYIIY